MADKAEIAFIQQLVARMGKSGDAAGILTLFAHMAELEARLTAARAANLDKLDGNISTVIGYTDTLESNLGTTGDSANAAGTLHAKVKDIRDWLGATSLGAPTDVANAAGTVLARLAELLTNRLSTTKAGYLDMAISGLHPGFLQSSFSTINAAYQIALNVSGKGYLHCITTLTPADLTASGIKLTLDGNIIFDSALTALSGGFLVNSNGLLSWANNGTPSSNMWFMVPFKSNLKIELKSDGTRSVSTNYMYSV